MLLVVLWACYGLLRVVIAHNQRRLGRRQEAQERLWRVLHPLLGQGGARQVSPQHRRLGGRPYGRRCIRWMVRHAGGEPPDQAHPGLAFPCRGGPSFRALRAVRPRLAVEFVGLGMELPDGRSILSGVTGR